MSKIGEDLDAARDLIGVSNDILREINLTVVSFRILEAVIENPGIRPTELSRTTGISNAAMNSYLNRLEGRHYVRRVERPNPKGEELSPVTSIVPLPKGEKIYAQAFDDLGGNMKTPAWTGQNLDTLLRAA